MKRGPVVYFHIGAMKTGTTFLQHLMIANQEQLASAGVHFGTWVHQVHATQDLLGLDQDDPIIAAQSRGAWQRLVDDVTDADAPTCIVSMEFLSFARPRQVRELARTLAGAEVHVVLTVRDAVGIIPAQWQTRTTSGGTATWPEFMRGVRKTTTVAGRLGRLSPDPSTREFRHTQDIPAMLDVWSRVVPADRLHVVTVPTNRGRPMELWERFAAVLHLDPEVATEPPKHANESLGYPSTEIVRRVNLALGDVPRWDYNRTVKTQLGGRFLGPRRSVERKPHLDEETLGFALDWNRTVREAICSSGAELVGTLTDLPVQADRVPGAVLDDPPPSDQELLAAARDGALGLVDLIGYRQGRLRRRDWPTVDLPQLVTDLDPDRWSAAADPVSAAVGDLAELCRIAMDKRAQMREARAAARGAAPEESGAESGGESGEGSDDG